MALLMLMCLATASASAPGSAGDPLITLGYLQGSFYASLKADIDALFAGAADAALEKLDDAAGDHLGFSFAPRFTRVSLAAGDRLTLSFGASFILISGTAVLAEASGQVINIATGREVDLGTQLTRNNRYFCTEDTLASIAVGAASIGQVDGYYLLEKGIAGDKHPAFSDVFKSDPYYDAVDYLYVNGIVSGDGQGRFAPYTQFSRAMYVALLYNVEGNPAVGVGGYFKDVKKTDWYHDAVTWAKDNDIVVGNGRGSFQPSTKITRQDMAMVLYNYHTQHKGRDGAWSGALFDSFTDKDDVTGYAVVAVRWATSNGIVNALSDSASLRFGPKVVVTRADAAQAVYNYYVYMQGGG
jgi:hypothetical protein